MTISVLLVNNWLQTLTSSLEGTKSYTLPLLVSECYRVINVMYTHRVRKYNLLRWPTSSCCSKQIFVGACDLLGMQTLHTDESVWFRERAPGSTCPSLQRTPPELQDDAPTLSQTLFILSVLISNVCLQSNLVQLNPFFKVGQGSFLLTFYQL